MIDRGNGILPNELLRRNFRAEMTQEALYKQKKQEEVAQLMKAARKLMDDAKYKEAYVELQRAQSLDPDDPASRYFEKLSLT